MPKFNVIAGKGVKFILAISGNEVGMNAVAVVLGATKMVGGGEIVITKERSCLEYSSSKALTVLRHYPSSSVLENKYIMNP